MILPKDKKFVVVGAGCFGVSTAYHLLQRGYTDVSILDRSTTLPAPDAASNDFNRIVRSSYSDKFYTELAREAISSWKDREKWGDTYHESGVLVLGLTNGSSGGTYIDEAYRNDVALGAKIASLGNGSAIRAVFPPDACACTNPSVFNEHCSAYINRDGGWANAAQGVSRLLEHVTALKGRIFPGKTVKKLLRQNGKTTGVECSDGTVFEADLVIIATGSWTPSAFPDLDLGRICFATGQCVAMVQLSEKEGDDYRDCPVVLDFNSGFYVFPPNEKNIVKMAIHCAGYTHFNEANGSISTPRTVASDPADGLRIPKSNLQDLRANFRNVYPDLAEKPFVATRLCWYNDTPDEDWAIGKHPMDDAVILATGDSGHAYKFLPIIGRLVADLVEDKLDQKVVEKFAVDREVAKAGASRTGQAVPLDLKELYSPEDLL
ncbi:unnamed protein product [Cyclocybe aegerita]|uniref:FAD dependent oxidoreductase domain-containing protein n=1 Tax=Cyclocybe aegerita TaxID=1973307 RepID=A0A8S0WJR5_CYCAE|nr:unnamed protein product [Cyclocybe aegerita]